MTKPFANRPVGGDERTEAEASTRLGAAGEAAWDAGAVIAERIADEEAIRHRAYAIWEAEGCPHGRDVDHWYRARAEVAAHGQATAG